MGPCDDPTRHPRDLATRGLALNRFRIFENRHHHGASVPVSIFTMCMNRYKTSKTYGDTPFQDVDWMSSTVLIPASSFTVRRQSARYIPAIPLRFIQDSLLVGDALAVLLIAVMETRTRGIDEIGLGPSVWAKVGSPSKRVRSRLLRQIAKLPAEVCILVARRGRPHLLKTGPAWPRAANETQTGRLRL